jgi:pSer/pThr/pTyr-binding forkhead associated (FHA) protein
MLRPTPGELNGRVSPRAAASVSGARLVAKNEQAQFAVTGEKAVIGRIVSRAGGNDNVDIDLSSLKRGAERVSRHHAEIVKLGRDYFIRDLGSLNGTYILGRGRLGRDQLYKLNDHDEVILGGARLEFVKG